MNLRLRRRSSVALGSVFVAAAALAAAFGPMVRAVVTSTARRWHVSVQVASVSPRFWGVAVGGASLEASSVPGVRLVADEVLVDLSWRLRPRLIAVHGAKLLVTRSAAALRGPLQDWWRSVAPGSSADRTSAEPCRWVVDDGNVRWSESESAQPGFVASDVRVDTEGGSPHFAAAELNVRIGSSFIRMGDVEMGLGAHYALRAARAASLAVDWSASPAPTQAEGVPEPSPGVGGSGRSAEARWIVEWAKRLLPDTGSLRSTAAGLGPFLREHAPEGAIFRVAAAVLKLNRDQGSVPLTLGPGPLTLGRAGSDVEIRFSTDPSATGHPFVLRIDLPLDSSDLEVNLDGGPVSLDALGIHEGALGLLDVAQASASGRAHVALATKEQALSFDVEGAMAGVAIDDRRVAPEPVRGLNVQVRARGAATAAGELRIDDAAIDLGALRASASGQMAVDDAHVEGTMRFEVGAAPCQAILDSIPSALLSTLRGTRVAGTFGATADLRFDSRALDDLRLTVATQYGCVLRSVSPTLARERFGRPFTHPVVLGDGSLGEHETGPGSDSWAALDDISPFMQVAVLTTEDAAFPSHHGFSTPAIRSALIADLRAGRFVRGASTITMQLAKNLFLTREKNLARKLEEVLLAALLEQTFSKAELMELYLNVVEFGPSVYGVADASEYYFGRTPAELNLAESFFLASLLPSPIRYGAMRDTGEVPDGWMRGLHSLMSVAHRRGRISDADLSEGLVEPIVFWRGGSRPETRQPTRLRGQVSGVLEGGAWRDDGDVVGP